MNSEQKLQKTEKAAVNIGVVELAQIDVLVDNLLYTNRSDFIRTAIRKQLECHQEYIHEVVVKSAEVNEESAIKTIVGIGVIRLSAGDLRELQEKNKKAKVTVVGVLMIDRSIDAALFDAQVDSIKVYGKLQVPKHLSAITAQKRIQ